MLRSVSARLLNPTISMISSYAVELVRKDYSFGSSFKIELSFVLVAFPKRSIQLARAGRRPHKQNTALHCADRRPRAALHACDLCMSYVTCHVCGL